MKSAAGHAAGKSKERGRKPPLALKNMKNTPWRTNRDATDRPGVYDSTGNRVADCDSSIMLSDDEKRANAALIAAAPRLLTALKELRDWYREQTGLPAADANAAIAAASLHNAESIHPESKP